MIAPWIEVADLEDPTSPYAAEAIESASYILWLLTARKYGGVRTTTEVYCQLGPDEIASSFPVSGSGRGMHVYPEVVNGGVTNRVGGCCNSCGCPHLLRLRGAPVLSVQAVYDGDREVPLDTVAIYDYSYIVAGNGCWNACGELEVTYTYGAPPPSAGKNAAKVMADQYILAMTGDDACALPQRVTQVSRQGVSWTLLDPQDFLDKGLTGIYSVDLFIRAVNPSRALLRPRVFSPDIPRAKTYRWAGRTRPFHGGKWSSTVQFRGTASVTRVNDVGYRAITRHRHVLGPTHPGVRKSPDALGHSGAQGVDRPPVLKVQPSGQEIPPDALTWRSGNYTLDLTAAQVEQLIPSGSTVTVLSQADDGSTVGQASYPVEWRTA